MEPKHISCDKSTRYQSFIAKNLDSYNQCGISVCRGRQIRACFHGWVILSNHPDSVLWSLWNPLTSKLIRLPPLIYKEKYSYECCLSSPPDDQGSVFLLLSYTTPIIVFCRLDREKKKLKWTKMSYAKQIRTINGVDCFLQCPTCSNGKVYAITTFENDEPSIIQVDIVVKGNEVVISLLPFVKVPHLRSLCIGFYCRSSSWSTCYFLKGSSTELFYIDIYFKGELRIDEVYLFKLDMKSMMWEEIKDLKDAVFFLEYYGDNSYSIFYKSAVTSKIRGYVHILGEMDKIIYSFHVKDRTMSLSLMPSNLRESQLLVWAMLECGVEVDHHDSKQDEPDEDTEIVIRRVNHDETEFVSTTSESYLLNIPFHILKMIMKNCVGVDYMKFRATCKRCYSAAPPIQWSSKATLRRWEMHSMVSPWLMVLDNYQGIMTFIDPLCGDKYFIKIPQDLGGDWHILCSKYGWLLMFKLVNLEHGHKLVFFNPFTKNIRKLPVVRELFNSFCFSAPPTSPDCMVVGFTLGTRYVYIHFVSHEPPSWHRYQLEVTSNDLYYFYIPTFSCPDIYVLFNNERIDAFRNISEEDFSWEIVKDKAPTSCRASSTWYFLSNCDQHLLFIIVGEFGEPVEVFKLNDFTNEWEKMDGLGKYMIYVSETSCICLEAKSPQMGNKIYFPRLLDNADKKIVFYSLDTCMYHTFHNNNIEESFATDFFGSKDVHHTHTWIEPSWS